MKKQEEHNDNKKGLEYVAPRLFAISIENPFRVPEAYFEGLEDEITYKKRLVDLDISKYISPFKTPDGYFENLEMNIVSEIELGDEDREFNPNLPDGYFDEMHDSIMDKIETEKKSVKVVSIEDNKSKLRILPWIAAAAAVLIAAVIIYQPKDKECQTFACLLEQTSFSNEDMLYFSDEEIFEFYEDDIQQEETSSDLEEEFNDYLIESDLDIDDLYDELYDEYE